MKILVTGASGYIGRNLIPKLIEAGHEVFPLLRSEGFDLTKRESLEAIPDDIETAYYLVHSLTQKNFESLEEQCARNFLERIEQTQCKQVIYAGALASNEPRSRHFRSKYQVEKILCGGKIPVTVLRFGIIIGRGSAGFDIMWDLVGRLPVMTTPRWVTSPTQPIAIDDILFYFTAVAGNESCYDRVFEIGGPDIMSYRDMMVRLGQLRGRKNLIINVPLLTPRLSSYWLVFVTRTNFQIAQALIDGLKQEVVCTDKSIDELLPHKCMGFDEAVEKAFS